jgi:DNA-binding IscR family transcriptional regulator
MKITSRFTIAVHTLLCIETFCKQYKVTSDFIAGSVNVNPVIIRRTLGQLRDAGFVTIARGTGGAFLARALENITLLDVYQAVGAREEGLFNFQDNPNPSCPVGSNIHNVLDGYLDEAQNALEDSLRKVSLSMLVSDLSALMKA